MSLEYLACKKGLFVTLTYSNEHLRYSPSGKPSLCKKDFQDFMKRVRKELALVEIRFFACGEYGSKTERPHYHAIIYGIDESSSDVIAKKWPYGMVACGGCTVHSIQYVAGYCLKKLVNPKNTADDRVPEFTLSSRRPGIGVPALDFIAKALKQNPELFKLGDFAEDVPGSLTVLGKNLPLGRFMVAKLRQKSGLDPDRENFDYISQLRDRFFEVEHKHDDSKDELLTLLGPLGFDFVSDNSQKVKTIEGKLKIFNRRSTI